MPYARELVIRYGGFGVGAGTSYELHGELLLEDSFESARVAFSVIVQSTTEQTFKALCVALEKAFRKPWQSLEIWQRQARFASYHAGQGTGLNAVPTIRKEGSDADTGRSRLYRIEVTMQRPADNVPLPGLREHAVRATFDPARLATVEISGVFTKVGTVVSYAQYRARVASLVTSVLSAYTGTFELVSEEEGWNINATLCPFRRVYAEVAYAQPGGLGDTSIVQQRLSITPSEVSDWDAGSEVARTRTIEARYTCWLDKSVVSDPATKEADIRAFVLTKIAEQSLDDFFVVASEDFTIHRDEWRIEARYVAWTVGDQTHYSRTVTVEDTDDKGVVIIPAWSKNSLESAVFSGPRVYRRVLTDRGMVVGHRNVKRVIADAEKEFSSRGRGDPDLTGTGKGGEWVVTHRGGHATQVDQQGVRDGEGGSGTLQATEYEARIEARWLVRYAETSL